jgi:hypothetical protein
VIFKECADAGLIQLLVECPTGQLGRVKPQKNVGIAAQLEVLTGRVVQIGLALFIASWTDRCVATVKGRLCFAVVTPVPLTGEIDGPRTFMCCL